MDDDRADDPLAPFRWHPEPELIGIRDAATSREALERAGRATWDASLDWLYDEAMVRAMGQPTDYAELRRTYFGERAAPGPAPADPAAAPGGARRVHAADRAAHAQQLPPPGALLLHPAAAGRLDRRRGPRPVDEPGRRRLARRARRGVRGGGGRPLAVRPRRVRRRQLRPARVGRRDGELHRDGARPRRPPPRVSPARRSRREAPRSRASASTPATRRTSRSPGRSTSSGFPPETLVSVAADDRFRLHAAPVAEAIARDRAAGLRPVAIAAVAGSTNTGSVDLVPELADARRARGPVAARRRRVRRRRPPVGAGQGPRPGPPPRGQRDHRPAQVVLPGLRRRRAGRPRRAPPPRHVRPLARVLPRRRGGRWARTTTTADHGDDAHAGQLNFYKLGFEGTRRFRALKLWATWKHLGHDRPRPADRGQRRRRGLPGAALRRGRRPRGTPRGPGAERRLLPPPAGRRGGRAGHGDGRPRRPPGPPRRGARAIGRRLALDDVAPRIDVAARRRRELPHDRGRHRPPARDAPPPRLTAGQPAFDASRAASRSFAFQYSPASGRNHARPSYGAGTSGNDSDAISGGAPPPTHSATRIPSQGMTATPAPQQPVAYVTPSARPAWTIRSYVNATRPPQAYSTGVCHSCGWTPTIARWRIAAALATEVGHMLARPPNSIRLSGVRRQYQRKFLVSKNSRPARADLRGEVGRERRRDDDEAADRHDPAAQRRGQAARVPVGADDDLAGDQRAARRLDDGPPVGLPPHRPGGRLLVEGGARRLGLSDASPATSLPGWSPALRFDDHPAGERVAPDLGAQVLARDDVRGHVHVRHRLDGPGEARGVRGRRREDQVAGAVEVGVDRCRAQPLDVLEGLDGLAVERLGPLLAVEPAQGRQRLLEPRVAEPAVAASTRPSRSARPRAGRRSPRAPPPAGPPTAP